MPVSSATERRIRRTVCAVPYGRVSTYGWIADLAGFPRQARLVGYVLYRLPADSAVPWHRVINAKGMISFPLGSEAYRKQQALLIGEGIVFIGPRIDLRRFGWRPSLDELLWRGIE